MSNADGSTTTPRSSTTYSARSTRRKVRTVIQLDPDLREFVELYAKANGESVSKVMNDLARWLKEEA